MKPFADGVATEFTRWLDAPAKTSRRAEKVGASAFRHVPCKFFPDELCMACGPDRDLVMFGHWGPVDQGPQLNPAPPPTPRLDSPIERRFWDAYISTGLWRAELAGLVSQHPVLGGRYRLDFALPQHRVGIELDGYEYHSSRNAFTRDRARQRAIEVAGWRVIRFSGAEINEDPHACVHQAATSVAAFTQAGATL